MRYGLPILHVMGNIYHMKTTVEIADALMRRAKRHARAEGTTLRALVEEGLRRVLASGSEVPTYRLEDRSIGKAGEANPLENLSWQDLRDEIYGSR